VHNWAHNVRSPEHADAELSAMRDTGIRGRFAYGPAQGMPDDQPMDLAGLARVKRDWMPGDGLLTLGICSRNVGSLNVGGAGARGVITIDMVKTDWGGARALGLPITMHTSGASPIMALDLAGLLGPDVQLVHPLLTTAEERAVLKARGQLLHLAHRRVAPPGQRGRGPAGRAFGRGHQGEPFDRPHHQRQLRPVRGHAHPVQPAPAPYRRQGAAHAEAPGAARHARRRGGPWARRPDRLAHARQARRPHPGAHDRHQHDAGGRPLRGAGLAGAARHRGHREVDGRILRQGGKFTALDHAKAVREAQEAALALRAKAGWPPA
jgi:hypothetical protein